MSRDQLIEALIKFPSNYEVEVIRRTHYERALDDKENYDGGHPVKLFRPHKQQKIIIECVK